MAVNPIFEIIWASDRENINPINDTDYSTGWNFLGSNNLVTDHHDFVMKRFDEKTKWLHDQLNLIDRHNNLNATTDPTANDDESEGYGPLSQWVNTSSSEIFTCIVSTVGAAVWLKGTLTIDELGNVALLNANTVGQNLIQSANPSAIRFLRVNADNTISWLTAADYRTAIGAGTGSSSARFFDAVNTGAAKIGSNSAVADADYAVAVGRGVTRGMIGAWATSGGLVQYSQRVDLLLRSSGSGSSVLLTSDGNSLGGGNVFLVREESLAYVTGTALAFEATSNSFSSWDIKCLVTRDGSADPQIVGTPVVTKTFEGGANAAGYGLTWSVDTTLDALLLTGTSAAASPRFMAHLSIIEYTY